MISARLATGSNDERTASVLCSEVLELLGSQVVHDMLQRQYPTSHPRIGSRTFIQSSGQLPSCRKPREFLSSEQAPYCNGDMGLDELDISPALNSA